MWLNLNDSFRIMSVLQFLLKILRHWRQRGHGDGLETWCSTGRIHDSRLKLSRKISVCYAGGQTLEKRQIAENRLVLKYASWELPHTELFKVSYL